MRLPSSTPVLAALLLVTAFGCRPPIEAPDTIEEMMNYGFVHFESDAEYTLALADNLVPFVLDNIDEASEGWGVNSLSVEDLEGAGVEEPDVENIIGGAASAPYEGLDVDLLATGITDPNKTEILEMLDVYDVLESSDRDCFLAHECETYEALIYRENRVVILGVASQTIREQYRWIEVEGQAPMVAVRSMSPDGMTFSNPGIMRVDQQYAFALLFHEDADTIRRMEAFWVDGALLGLDLPAGYTVRQMVTTMQESAQEMTDHLLGNDDEE